MIILTIQFLLIFLLTNCSINSKSKFWKEGERKKIETSSEIELFKENGLSTPKSLECFPFYRVEKGKLFVSNYSVKSENKYELKPIILPVNAKRFHLKHEISFRIAALYTI